MNAHDFTTTFTVDQTPDEAFAAITDVRGWWSGEIDGDTDALGAEFTYRYKDVHRSKQRIVEFVPGKKVVWLVLDAYLQFTDDKSEWNGTKVIFEVSPLGNQTQVTFTHEGLVPQFECFGACSSAWGSYINGSLKSLVTTGKGFPNEKESAG
jgi:hypothetical protein